MRVRIAHFRRTGVATARPCPLCLGLPRLGEIGGRFTGRISAYVRKCCFASGLRVVCHVRAVLPSGREDVLPHPPS